MKYSKGTKQNRNENELIFYYYQISWYCIQLFSNYNNRPDVLVHIKSLQSNKAKFYIIMVVKCLFIGNANVQCDIYYYRSINVAFYSIKIILNVRER